MNINGIIRSLLAALLLQPVVSEAQDGGDSVSAAHNIDSRIVHNARMIAVGATDVLDTYLSPEKYTGIEMRYMSHTTKPTRFDRFSMVLSHQGELLKAHNRADNNDEIGGYYNFHYAWRYNWNAMGGKLHLEAGAGADVLLGFLYNLRNGNNPAQAKMSLSIVPSAAAVYNFNAWHKPFSLRYEVFVPLAGIMFSPNYGQSYHEIFNKGDYDHNIAFTYPGNAPSLSHSLSLDFPLGKTWVRIGYMGDCRQSKVNELKYHNYSHMFMLGIVRHFSITKYRPR